jgi:hypothetical protein
VGHPRGDVMRPRRSIGICAMRRRRDLRADTRRSRARNQHRRENGGVASSLRPSFRLPATLSGR